MAKRKKVSLKIKETVYSDNSSVIDASIPMKYYFDCEGGFEGITICVADLNSDERTLVNKLTRVLKLRR